MQFEKIPFKVMGTQCTLQLYAKTGDAISNVAEKVIGKLRGLEARYSRYLPNSLISQINHSAGDPRGAIVDEETASLLDYSAACYEQSDGLFDITSGVLRKAWNFRGGSLPSQQAVDALLPLVGWEKLIWNKPRLILPIPGMDIDFGGVVKEYAADVAAGFCRESGIQSGLVELGGDISIIGPHPDGKPWEVGIQHPDHPASMMASISLTEGAIATSGDYERSIVVKGKRYGHILNPKTGWPVQGLISVSVVAKQCVVAGSASTIALLKGEEGVEWLTKLGLSYIYMNTLRETSGTLQTLTV